MKLYKKKCRISTNDNKSTDVSIKSSIFIYFILTEIQSSVKNWNINLKIAYGLAVYMKNHKFSLISNTKLADLL